MLSRCEANRALSHDDGFEIGLHHALDSKCLRNLSQFIQLEPLAAPRVRQRFERDVQADLVPETKAVTRIVEQTGPAGWLDWLLNFRNMLVHRGRRIEIGQFVPRLPFLPDPRGRPIMRANVITQLPQEPDRSDVDVHLEPNIPPVLTEDVRQTLAGAMGSVRTLIEALAEQLIAAWDWRKANPDALQQPRAQWPRIGDEARAGRRQPFMGYAPGTHQYEPGQLMSHPRTMRKMAAAALVDHQRHQWPNFD